MPREPVLETQADVAGAARSSPTSDQSRVNDLRPFVEPAPGRISNLRSLPLHCCGLKRTVYFRTAPERLDTRTLINTSTLVADVAASCSPAGAGFKFPIDSGAGAVDHILSTTRPIPKLRWPQTAVESRRRPHDGNS